MKIRVEKFCSLATARDWQTWLYHYDQQLYAEFIAKLRQARGCNDNRKLMVEILEAIDDRGDGPRLSEFLRSNYPRLIIDERVPDEKEWDKLFGTNVLTFPHRKILSGSGKQLTNLIKQFLSDKINYEFVVKDDKAYIEYLNRGEEHLIADIPARNWLTRINKNG